MDKNICILSGRYPKSNFTSIINHKAYAFKHGYKYINCSWPTPATNPYYNKLYYILEYIEHYDYIFWIDDDAFFINLDISIDKYLPRKNQILTACKSPTYKKIHTYLSSGQLGLRGGTDSKLFIKLVINTSLELVKNWWTDDLGFFSNGDQDAIIFNLLTNSKYSNSYQLFDYKCFNSRIQDLLDTPNEVFILHFTGTMERKLDDYMKAQIYLRRGKTLLSNCEKIGLNIHLEDKKLSQPKTNQISLPKLIKKIIKYMKFFGHKKIKNG